MSGISSTPSPILSTRLQELLSRRAYPKTLCPSEIARSLSSGELRELGVSEWRDLMPQLRQMAFDARDSGELDILQKGEVVPRAMGLADVNGPIRIRKVVESEPGT
ncbi:hypothetical protein A1O1_03249 [Capronia coronata CBS 617.96]|uniref:Uncharacterized protein n=1 Tax=Capronia coronata CBS 617.96 TaxID=1182541 RepID=W9YZY8_9EURO|nr:uncharacterized protein A1O1_03249 [Capronia coronata CBS 617.96]EXJ94851.1 hypothetical protein A1O1_03249 [Capronia coronata CBS 617.96]